jgi:cystathionine gamma-synthase
MRIETLAVHAADLLRRNENDPITPPIVVSTTFERGEDGSFKHDFVYTRSANPNRASVEAALAALEGGKSAAAFSSGSAATTALFQALAPGDHVIASRGYYGTRNILEDVFLPWGLQHTLLDTSDLTAVRAAVKPETRMIWVETPSNPLIRVSDIAAIAQTARDAKAVLVCDNTVGTPVLQRCFELGADVTLHSSTKYLGGHGDLLGGAVVFREVNNFAQRVKNIQSTGGAVPSPFDCWLLQRGMRTLPLRVRAQSESALKLAHFLAKHKAVERVLYPGLRTDAGYPVAAKQMKHFGGLMSLLVRGSRAEAMRVAAKLKLIRRATSLGGTESTIEHRASVEPPGSDAPENLLRLSVGIEHVDDLIADLEQALK